MPVVRLGTPPQRESLLSAHIPDITAFLQDHRETHQDGDVNRKAGEDTADELKVKRKTRKVVFRKKLTETFFSAADTTGRNSAISCRIYPSNTTSHLIHPCHCTTHREGLSSQGCTNKDTP